MQDHLIHFEKLNWENPQPGVRQKIYSADGQRLRLLRFSDVFVEADWCLKGHVGFVLSGEMKIDFDGKIEHFQKGDGLWINAGESSKHKVIMEKGNEVELILFESDA